MSAIRVSAVEYLNARPLVHGLEEHSDLFDIHFNVPSKCAALLHDGSVDLGLIPSIEYLRKADYRVVPDIAVSSKGAVASVALFTQRPTTAIRSIAIDSSSKTAVSLLRILCAKWFDIEPTFVTLNPDLSAMLKRCDAALLIGDRALYTEHETSGLDKIDLGDEWVAMTDLPFVWAFWAGRQNAIESSHIEALQAARDAGVKVLDSIAEQYASPGEEGEQIDIARTYLHENVEYVLGDQERVGLKKFFDAAAELGIVRSASSVHFY